MTSIEQALNEYVAAVLGGLPLLLIVAVVGVGVLLAARWALSGPR